MKTTVRYHHTTIKMSKIKKSKYIKCSRECRETETFIHCWWGYKMVDIMENSLTTVCCKVKNTLTMRPSNLTSGYLPWRNEKPIHKC